MTDATWRNEEVTDFGGEWTLIDQDDQPPDRSLKCLNCFFIPGSVFTRNGFATVFDPSDIVNSMFHWLFGDASSSARSYLVWHKEGYGVRLADLSFPSPTSIYAVTGAKGAVFAGGGSRLYSAHYNTAGVGVDGGKVYAINVGADVLFARPMLTTEVTLGAAAPDPGGECTPGTRSVAFLMTTRNGFEGRPAPVDTSLVLQPTSVTTTAANGKFLVTVTPTPTWAAWAGTIDIVMTTTADLTTYYYIPLSTLAVPPSGTIPVTFVVSINDDDLVLNGFGDITDNFFLLTQTAGGGAPFYPSSIFNAGSRMGYVFRSAEQGQGVYFSEPNAYQQLIPHKNVYYLPGQLEVVVGFYKDGTNYLAGPNWTYGVSDTGGFPSTWSSATCISSSIGTICTEGVSFDMARGIGWVAHTSGLFRLADGRYDDMPASYMNEPTWKKINWAVASYSLRVVDSFPLKTVMVAAPLNATGVVNTSGTAVTWVSGDEFSPAWVAGQAIIINAVSYSIASMTSRTSAVLTGSAGTQTGVAYSVTPTVNTHVLAWNYTKGDSVDKLKFSLWFMRGVAPASVCMVQNYTNKKQEVWMGPGAVGAIYRMKQDNDSNRYRDESYAIDSLYVTGLFGNDGDGGTLQHHGADFRVSGSGTLAITASTMDGAQSATLSSITLAVSPGKEYPRRTRLISERVYYGVSNGNAVDAYFRLSLIRHWFSPYTRNR